MRFYLMFERRGETVIEYEASQYSGNTRSMISEAAS